jgi:hypothetical protein
VSQMGTSALGANANCYRPVDLEMGVFEGVEHDNQNRKVTGCVVVEI